MECFIAKMYLFLHYSKNKCLLEIDMCAIAKSSQHIFNKNNFIKGMDFKKEFCIKTNFYIKVL